MDPDEPAHTRSLIRIHTVRATVYILAMRMVKVNLCVCLVLVLLFAVHSLYSRRSGAVSTGETERDHASSECHERFNSTIAENLKVIANYPRGIADQYMWKIGANSSVPKKTLNFPVIATAFHSLHYPESMGLFRSIHKKVMQNPKYKGQVKVIVYNLGLTGRQLQKLKAKCMCEIRPFPFDELPGHLRDLDSHAFKPIIVQMLLMEFGFVWWVDSSVRFVTGDLDAAVNFAVTNSILFYVKRDVSKSYTVARQTDSRTFSYLKEDVCKFRNFSETVGGFVLVHFDNISRTLISAWAACALNKECISPDGTSLKKTCHLEQMHDGRCHKFDQSVLSILTRRLYRDTDQYPLESGLSELFVIKKNEIDHYFERCRPMLKCLS